MPDTLFITVHQWLESGSSLAFIGSFLWGLISVTLSPCHMASIPLIIAYVGGQNSVLPPRQAVWYAVNFTFGLFLTIIGVGLICLALGRIFGDVGPYWAILVGIVLIWVAFGMFRAQKCTSTGALLNKIQIKGKFGALLLGLAYGIISGVCTFGFLAPILGVITIQGKLLAGLLMIFLFGLGHCLPLAVAGIFSATIARIINTGKWQKTSILLKNIAAAFIFGLGIYLIAGVF